MMNAVGRLPVLGDGLTIGPTESEQLGYAQPMPLHRVRNHGPRRPSVYAASEALFSSLAACKILFTEVVPISTFWAM